MSLILSLGLNNRFGLKVKFYQFYLFAQYQVASSLDQPHTTAEEIAHIYLLYLKEKTEF